MRQTIRKSDLKRLVEGILSEMEAQYNTDDMVDEGIGNWFAAGADALSDMKNFTQGPSNSKLCNFIDNTRGYKNHLDRQGELRKASKYGYYDSPQMKIMRGQEHNYTRPGREPRSFEWRQDGYRMMRDGIEAQKRLDDYRRQKRAHQIIAQHPHSMLEGVENDIISEITESVIRRLRRR